MKKIIVTGGLGFIGSHTVVALLENNYEVVIVDNLCNSQKFILNNIEQITKKKPIFYEVDLVDLNATKAVFVNEKNIDAIIHFAAHKSVHESIKDPIKYYENNLYSLLNLLRLMDEFNYKNLVFSSSCTVYGNPEKLPVTENTPFGRSLCAYASTKQMCEDILEKMTHNKKINGISLRYFNPVGAHPSGLIGELPLGTPSNLMPFITQTAIGKQSLLKVWGRDYNTPDGSCIRDYIHVVDLAEAHIKACELLNAKRHNHYYDVFNVGTGKGISVLEMINAFERENCLKLNYTISDRRPGDIEQIFASTEKANILLKWKTRKSLKDMVVDAWNWEQKYPEFMV